MTVRRHHGDRIEWERAQGIWPGLVRSLDFSKRYAFSMVSRVETILSQEDRDQHGGDVQHRPQRDAPGALDTDGHARRDGVRAAGPRRRRDGPRLRRLRHLRARRAAASPPGGIFALERRRYLESRSRVALAPERFLDLLAVRQQRTHRRRLETSGAPSPREASARRPTRQRGEPDRLERRGRQAVFVDGVCARLRDRGDRHPCSWSLLVGDRRGRLLRARRGTSDRCARRRSTSRSLYPASRST